MTVVVRTISRILLPVGLAFGGYVVMHGHLTPGGGFQGGAVAASALAMVIVAFGAASLKGKKGLCPYWKALGGVAFAALGFLGAGRHLLRQRFGWSRRAFRPPGSLWPKSRRPQHCGPPSPLMNWAVGFKVLAGLSAVVLLFALFGGKDDR